MDVAEKHWCRQSAARLRIVY